MTQTEDRSGEDRILLEVLALEGDAREARLLDLCCEDKRLLAAIRHKLVLNSEIEAGPFMRPVVPPMGILVPEFTPGDEVAGCRIIRKLGEGGSSIVYLATDSSPERPVALKVPKTAGLSASWIDLPHEISTLARLEHTHFARIYRSATHHCNGVQVPVYVMEHVKGRDLLTYSRSRACLMRMRRKQHLRRAVTKGNRSRSFIGRLSHHIVHAGVSLLARSWVRVCPRIWAQTRRRTSALRAKVDLFVTVCDAVSLAHSYSIYHHDLKPENILVDESGEPRILDFGIASTRQDSHESTSSVRLPATGVGTRPYVPPEQFEASRVLVPAGAWDQYSLGVILHQIVSGQLPDRAGANRAQEPPESVTVGGCLAPRKPVEDANADIIAIASKAMAADPQQRYISVADLTSDIRNYLAYRPVEARNPRSRFYTSRKFMRRNRSAVATVLVIFLILLTGLCTTSWQWRQAEGLRAVAIQRALEAKKDSYADRVRLASLALARNDYEQLPGPLKSTEPREGEPDLRGFEWYYLQKFTHGQPVRLDAGPAPVLAVCPRTSLVAVLERSAKGPRIAIWNASEGFLESLVPLTSRAIARLAISPISQLLSEGTDEGILRFTEIPSGVVHIAEGRHGGPINCLAFALDGERHLSVSGCGTHALHAQWTEVPTGRTDATFDMPTDDVWSVATVTPSGEIIAAADTAGRVEIWSAATQMRLLRIATGVSICSLSIASSGEYAAAGSSAGHLYIWRVRDGCLVWQGRYSTAPIVSLTFVPAPSPYLAVSSDDRPLGLLNLATGQSIDVGCHLGAAACYMQFCGSESCLVLATSSGTVVSRRLARLRPSFAVRGSCTSIKALAFSQDGTKLAAVGETRSLMLGQVIHQIVDAISASAENRLSEPTLLSCRTWQPQPMFQKGWPEVGPPGTLKCSALTFSEAAGSLAVARDDGAVLILSPQLRGIVRVLPATGERITELAMSPDGQTLFYNGKHIALTQRRIAPRFHLEISTPYGTLTSTGRGTPCLASQYADGQWVYCRSYRNRLLIRSSRPEVGKSIVLPQVGLSCAALSRNGDTVALGYANGAIELCRWQQDRSERFHHLSGAFATRLAFVPDGTCLAAGTNTGKVLLLDLYGRVPDRTLATDELSRVRSLAISADGQFIAAGLATGRITVWNTHSGTVVYAARNGEAAAPPLCFSADGGFLAVGANGSSSHANRFDTVLRCVSWDKCLSSEGQLSVYDMVRLAAWFPLYAPLSDVVDCRVQTEQAFEGIAWPNRTAPFAVARSGQIMPCLGEGKRSVFSDKCIGQISAFTMSPGAKCFATGSNTGATSVWDSTSFDLLATFEDHTDSVTSVTLSGDGRLLASASQDGRVWVRDLLKNRCYCAYDDADNPPLSVAVSPNGSWLAVGLKTRGILTISIPGMHSTYHQSAKGPVMCLAFAPDGVTLAAAGALADGGYFIGFRRVDQIAPLLELAGTGAGMQCLAFSPDGRTLACGQADGTLRILPTSPGPMRIDKRQSDRSARPKPGPTHSITKQ